MPDSFEMLKLLAQYGDRAVSSSDDFAHRWEEWMLSIRADEAVPSFCAVEQYVAINESADLAMDDRSTGACASG